MLELKVRHALWAYNAKSLATVYSIYHQIKADNVLIGDINESLSHTPYEPKAI